MGVINFPELVEIGGSLEGCLKSLKQMQEKIESTWPATPEGDYFQILLAAARLDEALERVKRIIRAAKNETSRQ